MLRYQLWSLGEQLFVAGIANSFNISHQSPQYLVVFINPVADAELQILLAKLLSSPPLVEKFRKTHPNPHK